MAGHVKTCRHWGRFIQGETQGVRDNVQLLLGYGLDFSDPSI